MTDTEAIALRANRATAGHHRCDSSHATGLPSNGHCDSDLQSWPCDAASLAADIPELLARVRADGERIAELETVFAEAVTLAHKAVCGCSHPGWDTGFEHGMSESLHAAARAILE